MAMVVATVRGSVAVGGTTIVKVAFNAVETGSLAAATRSGIGVAITSVGGGFSTVAG